MRHNIGKLKYIAMKNQALFNGKSITTENSGTCSILFRITEHAAYCLE